mmetsp:Transcript_19656/g.40014  ORF Transcript_19656/g.40014 Transcript_19656/m.40014 type:complete len:292 (+) Transcript_19656:695-1570(+)
MAECHDFSPGLPCGRFENYSRLLWRSIQSKHPGLGGRNPALRVGDRKPACAGAVPPPFRSVAEFDEQDGSGVVEQLARPSPRGACAVGWQHGDRTAQCSQTFASLFDSNMASSSPPPPQLRKSPRTRCGAAYSNPRSFPPSPPRLTKPLPRPSPPSPPRRAPLLVPPSPPRRPPLLLPPAPLQPFPPAPLPHFVPHLRVHGSSLLPRFRTRVRPVPRCKAPEALGRHPEQRGERLTLCRPPLPLLRAPFPHLRRRRCRDRLAPHQGGVCGDSAAVLPAPRGQGGRLQQDRG